MASNHSFSQQFSVDFTYPVVFADDLFSADDGSLELVLTSSSQRVPDVLCFVDGGLAAARPDAAGKLRDWFAARSDRLALACDPIVIPGGEGIKNDYRQTMHIVDAIMEHRLCRQSYVIAVGGGAVLDAVGFAASIVHRGIRLVRLPTTVLAQCDAGLGVKNGMNLHGVKNMIGTFQPPYAVLNSWAWLDSLPFDHWIGGVSEAFKVALIKDAAFFQFLCGAAPALQQRDLAVMKTVVQRCAELHLDHIRRSGDAFEQGRARPLDFGHWSAHKLEIMSNCRVPHGQAVAIGVALDTLYAARQGFVSQDDARATLEGLAACGFPLWQAEMGRRLGDGQYELLQGIRDFREHIGGELTLAFPNGIGQLQDVHDINRADLSDAIQELEQFHLSRSPC